MSEQAKDILQMCKGVLAQRGQEYGDAGTLFEHIAKRFSLVLGHDIDNITAARLMVELKLARLDRGYKGDSVVDAINYLALAGALHGATNEQKE